MQDRFWKILVLSVLTILCSCSSTVELDETPIVQSERIIKFSGYDWIVRTSDNKKVGPGPNLFSDSEDNVWVDNQWRMHLKIVQRGGLSYCAGVILKNSLGHGKYVFYV